MGKSDTPSKSKPPPVYAVFGSDDYLKQQAVERIKTEILGDDRDQMALAEFEGERTPIADILLECRTASLLAPVRLVIVHSADKLLAKKDSDSEDGESDLEENQFERTPREILEEYLHSPCPTGVLVLVCKTWAKSTRLYKLVDRIGQHISCETPKAQAVPGWVASQAQNVHGVRLEPQAARRLVELVGPQLGLLDMELAKLATYVLPKKTIEIQDVEELVGASRAEVVFGLADAITARDAGGAMNLWDQVISRDRAAEYKAIGGLRFAFVRLVEAKRLVSQGLSVFEAAKSQKIWGDAHQLERQLDRFSMRQWQDILVKLLSIDVRAKTGLGSVRMLVERFIAEQCAVPGPRRVGIAGR